MRNETHEIPFNGNPYMRPYSKDEREEARKVLEEIIKAKKPKPKRGGRR